MTWWGALGSRDHNIDPCCCLNSPESPSKSGFPLRKGSFKTTLELLWKKRDNHFRQVNKLPCILTGMENGVVVPLFSSATTQENKLNIYAPSRECHECQATKWAVRPFYLKPSKVPAKRSMGVKPRARYQNPNRTLRLACTTWNYHRNHAETPKQPRKISGVWSRSTREFLPIKVFAISPGKYPRKMATSRAKTVRIHHRSRPCRLRSAQGPLPGPWWGPQNPDHHSQKNGDWPWTLRNAQLTIKIIKGWDKKPLKKTYKILGRKHQKARIPWKSWDSVSKIYVPTTKFPTPHHLVLKTIATSPTHCTKPQAKPSVQSSMPQLMRMKPSVMPTWPPFSMYVQVRHWLRTIRNNQTRLYTFYDIIHVYST